MNHRATFVLPLSASRVLDVLHSMFAVGELIAISQDEIARVGNISEASVSRAMPVLVEHGFIERMPDRTMNGGRGGYWLRLLPLPALEGSIADPSANGSTIDPLADERESRAPMPEVAFTASPCGTDQSLIPSAPPMVHDSCSNSSSNMRASGEKNDWSTITIAGLDFLPTHALEKAGVTPHSFLEADRKIVTRREYDRPAQIRILIRSLLTNQPIYSASELAARSEEPRHERPRSATPARARRGSRENRPAPTADPTSDPEYTAYLAECLAAPKAKPGDFAGLPVRRKWGAADGG